ncbi:MAG: hypothetical protein GWN18_17805, partial [Thermoplasmata archaeon]|nr:hypothetical protein [Thermoplasmata archaeon]NIS13980.1 hypothetical protein [Thermoplasmata archaeon]NIU50850.1 hypothetical protein [Thermoplasmata archaeon]NIW84373.1 hypothetical protein [Thermoplasmata archaeon]
WNGKLEPALRWTRELGMRTMVNLLAYKVPSASREALRAKWEEMDVEGIPDDRDLALFAAWAAANDIDLGVPTPKEFT